MTYATNAFFVGAPDGTGTSIFDRASSLLGRKDVEYCHPELVRPKGRRAIAAEQWHLKTTTFNGASVSASANVEAAHQVTTGAGTTIAIIYDGVDIDHPQFAGAGKIVAPRDATLGTSDPRPKDTHFTEDHGDRLCRSGLRGWTGQGLWRGADRETLADSLELRARLPARSGGVRMGGQPWGGRDFVQLGGRLMGNVGTPTIRPTIESPLPARTKLAIDYATTKGRGGKGCIVLFAAGNGNESVENDGYASYERVIAVAACNDRGKRSVYSNFGKAVWCSFPSSDRGHALFQQPAPLTPGIWTTDRTGSPGYNQ